MRSDTPNVETTFDKYKTSWTHSALTMAGEGLEDIASSKRGIEWCTESCGKHMYSIRNRCGWILNAIDSTNLNVVDRICRCRSAQLLLRRVALVFAAN